MRLDRFVTLGLVHPLRRAAARWAGPRPGRLPILMYHSISDDPESGVGPYYRTATTPARFAAHMRLIRERGWRAVTLADGLRAATGRGAENLVVVTFDDGFRDFFSAALPVLRAEDFGATLFLPTAFIAPTDKRHRFRDRECLSWAEVREIDRSGIELGSHTATHPQLSDLPWADVEAELARSKAEIEQRLGHAVASFSYPFAFPQARAGFCALLRGMLEGLGYQTCVTTGIGCASVDDDPYGLPRLPVNEADDPRLFAAKLDGDYDWLAAPQRAYKAWKAAF